MPMLFRFHHTHVLTRHVTSVLDAVLCHVQSLISFSRRLIKHSSYNSYHPDILVSFFLKPNFLEQVKKK